MGATAAALALTAAVASAARDALVARAVLGDALGAVEARRAAADRALTEAMDLKAEVAALGTRRAEFGGRVDGDPAALVVGTLELSARGAGLQVVAVERAIPRAEGSLPLHPVTARFRGDPDLVPRLVDDLLDALAPAGPLARISALELELRSFRNEEVDGWILVEVAGARPAPRPDGSTLAPFAPPPLPPAAGDPPLLARGLAARLEGERSLLAARLDALLDREALLLARDRMREEEEAAGAWIASAADEAAATRRATAAAVVRLQTSAMGKAGFRLEGGERRVYDDD